MPGTEEFGCRSSIDVFDVALGRDARDPARMLRSYRAQSILPASLSGGWFLRKRFPDDPANPEQLTADINAVLERQIRQSPADWFWVHNRWKTPWPHLLIGNRSADLLAAGHQRLAAVSLSLPCSLAKLAWRRRHEPEYVRAFKHGRLTPGSPFSLRRNLKRFGNRFPRSMKSSPLLKRNRCSPLQDGCAADLMRQFFSQLVSQRSGSVACSHSSPSRISRALSLNAAHPNH